MKIIITDKQHKLIEESSLPPAILRRGNKGILEPHINNGMMYYPTLCDDFDYPSDYAWEVIDYAVDELLYEIDDEIEDKDYYSDALDYLRGVCREEFEDYLISIYNMTCIEK